MYVGMCYLSIKKKQVILLKAKREITLRIFNTILPDNVLCQHLLLHFGNLFMKSILRN